MGWYKPDRNEHPGRIGHFYVVPVSGKDVRQSVHLRRNLGGNQWVYAGYIPADVLIPDTWYCLLIRLEEGGEVTMREWEKKHQENGAEFHQRMNSSWAGLRWGMGLQVYDGTIQFGRYMEVGFAGEE
jgi:hypothetical protein